MLARECAGRAALEPVGKNRIRFEQPKRASLLMSHVTIDFRAVPSLHAATRAGEPSVPVEPRAHEGAVPWPPNAFEVPNTVPHAPLQALALPEAGRLELAGNGAATGPVDVYRGLGPNRVRFDTVRLNLGELGTNDVHLYRPTSEGPHPLVVFGTGLGSSQAVARSIAGHLGTWGFAVAVPDLDRNNTPTEGAAILSSVVDRLPGVVPDLDSDRIAVAGHSWGGLSAVLAAQNPSVRALVALDPNDNRDRSGRETAPEVQVPSMFVFGRWSMFSMLGPDIYEAVGSQDKNWVKLRSVGHLGFVSRSEFPSRNGQRDALSHATEFLLSRL